MSTHEEGPVERNFIRIAAIVLFLFIYPGIIVLTSHFVENKSREHSDRVACIKYNDLAFAVNVFHGTFRDLIRAARDARQKELNALKTPGPPGSRRSKRLKKLIAADQQAVDAYNSLLSATHTTPYEKGCPVRTRGAKHVRAVNKKKEQEKKKP